MKRFQGIFAVLLTFFDGTGGIDRTAMEHMTDFLIDNGVHGLLVLGSNGECPYLTREQQRDAVEIVVKASAGRVPVIVGVNERGTEPTLEVARYAEELGANGLLAALHVFYQLDERDIYEHYETLCAATSLPVLYYNFPANSGLRLSPRSIARIAEIDGIVGRQDDHLRGGPDGGTGPSGRRGLLLLLRLHFQPGRSHGRWGMRSLLPHTQLRARPGRGDVRSHGLGRPGASGCPAGTGVGIRSPDVFSRSPRCRERSAAHVGPSCRNCREAAPAPAHPGTGGAGQDHPRQSLTRKPLILIESEARRS